MTEALIGLAVLMVLLLLRLPLAFAMGLVGVGGFYAITDRLDAAIMMGSRRLLDGGMDYALTVIPLFVLMGNFVARSGISTSLFRATNGMMGHYRGGQGMATVVASGAFAAICGSSLATVATMGRVAIPEMERYGYSQALSSATVAAGGTLGILIPPSVMLVIYGMLTETSVRDLFAAGLLPGILGIGLYVCAVIWTVRRRPSDGPAGPRLAWSERLRVLRSVWPTILLFVVVMGGIYLGVFTPTEAAGIGALGAFLIALSLRSLDLKVLLEILRDTVRTTASLFLIVLAAMIFANFVNRAGLPNDLLALVTGKDIPGWAVLAIIVAIYLVLGCVLESMSMMLLTVPVFFPVVAGLGYDLVWFGILVVILIEISLITPPVGMNCFVLRAVAPHIPTTTIFRGVIPFWCADVVRIAVVLLIPGFVLLLPNLLR